jgi:ABC-type glycerol-3-phosphate transport system substrate-binding protein
LAVAVLAATLALGACGGSTGTGSTTNAADNAELRVTAPSDSIDFTQVTG